ncbi:MAG TPA: FmdB family zinc ribbon protein [Candidatus Tumulicola sp.]|jgi:putative FmdB family regulatory protein
MPLYDYKCTQCGQTTEIRRGFDETHTDVCPSCGGKLARVFNPAPIVFKGSGFYVTDSRKSSSSNSPAPSESKPAAESKLAEPAKTESAPAAPKTEAPKPKASEPAA